MPLLPPTGGVKFHLHEDIVLPSLCPLHPEGIALLLNGVWAVLVSLSAMASFRKLDSPFVITEWPTERPGGLLCHYFFIFLLALMDASLDWAPSFPVSALSTGVRPLKRSVIRHLCLMFARRLPGHLCTL